MQAKSVPEVPGPQSSTGKEERRATGARRRSPLAWRALLHLGQPNARVDASHGMEGELAMCCPAKTTDAWRSGLDSCRRVLRCQDRRFQRQHPVWEHDVGGDLTAFDLHRPPTHRLAPRTRCERTRSLHSPETGLATRAGFGTTLSTASALWWFVAICVCILRRILGWKTRPAMKCQGPSGLHGGLFEDQTLISATPAAVVATSAAYTTP